MLNFEPHEWITDLKHTGMSPSQLSFGCMLINNTATTT